MSRLKVAILAGGRSSEHEISLASARSVLVSLDPAEYDVVTVAIGRDGRWELGSGDGSVAETLPVPAANAPAALGAVDVVFPILHGPFGEDGTVQGLLELAGLPYVGAGVAASALCMDKDLFKKVLRDSGIPVARHVALREGDPVGNPFGFPCFVKPARLGSSVGITSLHFATTTRFSSRSSSMESRSRSACSATGSPSRPFPARSCPWDTSGTTTPRSTRTAACGS
jgi:D-alanine-D-alanine ligase